MGLATSLVVRRWAENSRSTSGVSGEMNYRGRDSDSCPSNICLLSLPIPGRDAHRKVELLTVSTSPVVEQLESLS